MLNVVSDYVSHVGYEEEEKEKFWWDQAEMIEIVPRKESVVIGVL